MKTEKFDILYIDPPWKYNTRRNSKTKFGLGMSRYDGMTLQELCDLPVRKITQPNAAAFVWVTSPALKRRHPAETPQRYLFELAEAWGLYYVAKAFCWVKIAKDGSPRLLPGYYTGSNTEDCFLLVKGKMPVADKGVNQIVFNELGKQSEKPNEVRERITRLYPKARKLEMFARCYTPGWVSWGNETVNCPLQDAVRLRPYEAYTPPEQARQKLLFTNGGCQI